MTIPDLEGVSEGMGGGALRPSGFVPTEGHGAAVLAPKERPILFSGAMVRALLEGRKTQTRRVVKGEPVNVVPFIGRDNRPTGEFGLCLSHDRVINKHIRCPYGAPGDRLWVKETWRPFSATQDWDLDIVYREGGDRRTIKDGDFGERDWNMPKAAATGHVSPLFMPRWASRLTLEITEVRAERLQDISYDDCAAEGTTCPIHGDRKHTACSGLRDGYRSLWESINGPDSWVSNPWVWAVSFKVITAANDTQPGTPAGVHTND